MSRFNHHSFRGTISACIVLLVLQLLSSGCVLQGSSPSPGTPGQPLSGCAITYQWPEANDFIVLKDAGELARLADELGSVGLSLLPGNGAARGVPCTVSEDASGGETKSAGAGENAWLQPWGKAHYSVTLFYTDGRQRDLLLSRSLDLYDPATAREYRSDTLQDLWGRLVEELRDITYGRALGWWEVDKIFPRGGKALVRDVTTGVEFWVHRHGGTYHVDAQPLTAEDTRAMKALFGGEWSWKRRAVVVTTGGVETAASMNGMPHGRGSIRSNNFPGHFCIHFKDSITHGTRSLDTGHQLMVQKAAGRMPRFFAELGSKELVEYYLAAILHYDLASLAYLTAAPFPEAFFTSMFKMVRHFDVVSIVAEAPNGSEIFNCRLRVFYHPSLGKPSRTVMVTLRVQGADGRSLPAIDYQGLETLVDGD